MSYNYTDGDGISALDPATPNGATEPISILDNAIRQIKAYLCDELAGPQAQFNSLLSRTRVIATMSTAQPVVAGASEVNVEFDTEDLDSGSDYSISTFKFTAPDSGLFMLMSALTIEEDASSSPTSIMHIMKVYLDGSLAARTTLSRGADVSDADLAINRLFNISAGQTLSIRYELTVGSGTMSVNIRNNPLESIFQVVRIPTL